jgi:condensin-2 complex subunit D3
MLCIMSDASTLLESSRAMELAAMLLQQLTSFAVSGELIHGSVQTIASLCSAHSGPQAVETQRKWCTQVLQRCEEKLTSHLRNVDSDDDTVTRALITLGEVALIYAMGSDAIVKKTVTTTTNKTKTSPPSPCQSGVTYVARVTSVKTVLERLFRPVQAYVAPKQNTPISLSIRAQAFVSFGKLCLCDQSLARRCITVLIRELDTTKEPVLRNNILIILSDLCREHTALVDP